MSLVHLWQAGGQVFGVSVPSGGGGGGGGGTAFTTVTLNNFGGSTQNNPEFRFAHVFTGSAVPAGSTVTLAVGGTAIPATFARRASGFGGELRVVDILGRLPTNITAGGNATINVNSLAASSFNDTLPGGKSVAQILTDYTTNHDVLKVRLRGLTNSSAVTEGSGAWVADSAAAIASGTTAGETGYYETNATGPAACDVKVYAPFKDVTPKSVTLTSSSTTATATCTAHGLVVNQWVDIAGAAQANYNGTFKVITVPDANTFTYTMPGSATSPATGTITLTAHHFNLWCAFYLTIFLDTTTGAVTKISSECVIRQGKRNHTNDRYRCQIDLLLGSTVARSWGGRAGDGRTLDFATTDVNTATEVITLTGHTFSHAQLVRFTTTGTLPGGLSAGTDYWVAPTTSGAATVKVYSSFAGANSVLLSSATPVNLTSVGSGTHHIEAFTDIYAFQAHSLLDVDCDWDWHAGVTGTFGAKPTVHAIHSNTYYRSTSLAPAVDLALTFANPSDPAPASWSPGVLGGQNPDVNSGGLGKDYHMVWNNWQCQRLRYPGDRTGYVRSARVRARSGGMWRRFHVDETNLKLMTFNNTTYSGLAKRVGTYQFDQNGLSSADIPSALGGLGPYCSTSQLEFSHYFPNTAGNYYFDGGQSNLDMLLAEANMTMMFRLPGPNASFRYQRDYATAAGTFYPALPCTQPRSDAFVGNLITDAALCAADGTPQKTYFKDIAGDTFGFLDWLINTAYGSTFRAIGGWHVAETSSNGPAGITNFSTSGTANPGDSEETTVFMQSYLGQCVGHIARKWPAVGALAWATQMATWFDNEVVSFATCASYFPCYSRRIKANPSTGPVFLAPADRGVIDVNANGGSSGGVTGGMVFDSDGTVTRISHNGYTNGDIFPQNGDRIYLTDTMDLSHGYYGTGVPTAYTLYGTYYVRQASGSNTFKLATTNSDATIIGSVTQYTDNTKTLASGINASVTSLTTSGIISFASGGRFIRIGTELMRVTGGVGTTTLSVDRGVAGTTAALHSAADTIQALFVCGWYIDAQNRATGCPAFMYRHGDTAISGPIEGHATLFRSACANLYLAGKLSISAFNVVEAYWQQESGGGGPASFAAGDTNVDTAVTTI